MALRPGRPRQIRRKRAVGTKKRQRRNPKQRAAIRMRALTRARKKR